MKDTFAKRKEKQDGYQAPLSENVEIMRPMTRQHDSGYKLEASTENMSQISMTTHGIDCPRHGLHPHPRLLPVLYHISCLGAAMWPLESLLKFNLTRPTLWFDWALQDLALFEALLYTTSSYAGLLLGSTESKESIMHVGNALSLLRTRVLEPRAFGQVVQDSTVAAVSCLALTEVGWCVLRWNK